MIVEKAYAKINLALAVEEEKEGYHQVYNVMIPIDLYDELTFEKSKDTKVISTIEIKDNICLKAIHLFMEKFQIKDGVTVTLKKHIPMMAGLAGGSSDACSVLVGLNRLFNVQASIHELEELAAKLGSDVPFFLYRQLALCTGRGEIITPIDDTYPTSVLIVKPPFGLSTKEIYQNYQYDGLSKKDKVMELLSTIHQQKDIEEFIFNDLESVALSVHNRLNFIFNEIKKLGYLPHISGSGPSIYILNATLEDIDKIKKIDNTLEVYLCKTL